MPPENRRLYAPYAQVAAQLRSRIVSGELGPGDQVPSVREIAETWHIAKATAERVLRLLREEGLITTRPGARPVVNTEAPIYRSADDRRRQVQRTGRIYAPDEYAKILSAEQVPAPADVARALDLEPGAPVVRRERATFRIDEPTPRSTSTSWFTGDVGQQAPLLLVRERILQGTTRYVVECTGRTLADLPRHDVLARLASMQETQQFGLEPPAAVLETRHTAWDAAGMPLTYEVGVARPGHIMTITRNETR